MLSKNEIRVAMISKRNALTEEEVTKRSSQLVTRIINDPIFINSCVIALYEPINHEVDLRALFQVNKRFALPKVSGTELHFYEINDKTRLIRSSFGILEPENGLIVDNEIELLLVPALALDHHYYRVGFGKGYYDRFLAKHHPLHTRGVVYDFQLVDDFPLNEHDIALGGVYIA